MTINTRFNSTYLLLLACLVGFAGNSVLCRLAIKQGLIDPSSFTALRIGSAIITLLCIYFITHRSTASLKPNKRNVIASVLLFTYALLLSYAYRSLPTGEGALLLFAAVQTSIMCAAVFFKEHITFKNWLGNGFCLFALIILLLPNSNSNNLNIFDSFLMVTSGVAWGFYTVLGRKSLSALQDTTINFTLCIPWLGLILLYTVVSDTSNIQYLGAIYAVLSGALMSALTYSVWYLVLPKLSSSLSASAQMSVPLIAAFGGIVFVGEPITLIFCLSFIVLAFGIYLCFADK